MITTRLTIVHSTNSLGGKMKTTVMMMIHMNARTLITGPQFLRLQGAVLGVLYSPCCLRLFRQFR